MSSGSNPIRPAISSLAGLVPSEKSARSRSPVSLLSHQFVPTSCQKTRSDKVEPVTDAAYDSIRAVMKDQKAWE